MWNRAENQIRLILIRHGATESNKGHRYLGKTEEALSKEGEKELSMYKSRHYYPEVEQVFCSPMKRCLQTAEILYPEVTPIPIEEWEEIDFGAFEGRNYLELQDDVRYQEWIDSNGTLPFPEGESREVFIKRCDKGFRKMLQIVRQNEKETGTIGVIVHGGTIMALLSQYGGGEYFTYQAANGKGYVCIVKIEKEKLSMTDIRKI